MRLKSKKPKSEKNKTNIVISISATEVFEYIKCPAFFKHYINSGKTLNDCYTDSYKNIVFSLGNTFESIEIKKINFAKTEVSLQELIDDLKTSLIRLEPPIVIKRELPQNEYLEYYKAIAFATGRPDLLVRDEKTEKIVPFEYKTSDRYIEPTKYQLLHYCYLTQAYDSNIPNIGYLKTMQQSKKRINLQKYKEMWEWVVLQIELLKLGVYDLNQILAGDLRWDLKNCRQCYFNSSCHDFLKLHTNIKDLYQVGKSRLEMIHMLDINTVEELANMNIKTLWNRLKAIPQPDARIIFQQENVIRKIVGNAKAIIKGKPVLLYSKLEQNSFNLSLHDAFFDLEYISSKSNPVIFSICLGIIIKDGSLAYKTWFAENEDDVETIVDEFYKNIKSSKLFRLMGWGIKTADLPMLKKIAPYPDTIYYFDLFKYLEDNIALPILSYSLKPVSEYIFGKESTSDSEIHGGLDAVDYYNKYLQTRDNKYKDRIIFYNEQDVRLTYEVAKWIESFYQEPS